MKILFFLFSAIIVNCAEQIIEKDMLTTDTQHLKDSRELFQDTYIKPYCGDGVCYGNETMTNCWKDCKPKILKSFFDDELPFPYPDEIKPKPIPKPDPPYERIK